MAFDWVSVGVMLGSAALFAAAASMAFGWAISSGQFADSRRAAESIFGPDEPVGEVTDAPLGPSVGHSLRE